MRRALVRRLDRRLDRAGLLRFDGASQQYPSSGAEFTALTGVTASSLYLFDEASGTLDDKIGAADLPVVGTPTYAYSVSGRRGVYYDAGTDGNNADVNAVGSSSFATHQVCALVTNPGTNQYGIYRRTSGSSPAQAFMVFWALGSNGYPQMFIRDGTSATQANPGSGSLDIRSYIGRPFIVSQQIDKAGARMYGRVSMPGVGSFAADVSIAGYGSLDVAGQKFGIGIASPTVGATATGFWTGWAAFVLGAGAEGASYLQNMHRALGWE